MLSHNTRSRRATRPCGDAGFGAPVASVPACDSPTTSTRTRAGAFAGRAPGAAPPGDATIATTPSTAVTTITETTQPVEVE